MNDSNINDFQQALKYLTNFMQVNVKKKINEPVNEPVNERQKQIIQLIKKNNKITIINLANKIGVGRETIKIDLKKLRQLDFIKRIGPDKGGYWEVIK